MTLLVGVLLIVVPIVVLAYVSLIPYMMAPGKEAFSMLTLDHWKTVLGDSMTLRAFGNSVFLAVAGATLGILLSTLASYIIVRVRSTGSAVLETLVFTSFAFPGLIIGIGFMWAFVRTSVYATIWALLIGYVATYLPFGIRPLTSTFIQIGKDLRGRVVRQRGRILAHVPAGCGAVGDARHFVWLDVDGGYVRAGTGLVRHFGEARHGSAVGPHVPGGARRALGPGGYVGRHHDRLVDDADRCHQLAGQAVRTAGLGASVKWTASTYPWL